jgi:hypothetical protein
MDGKQHAHKHGCEQCFKVFIHRHTKKTEEESRAIQPRHLCPKCTAVAQYRVASAKIDRTTKPDLREKVAILEKKVEKLTRTVATQTSAIVRPHTPVTDEDWKAVSDAAASGLSPSPALVEIRPRAYTTGSWTEDEEVVVFPPPSEDRVSEVGSDDSEEPPAPGGTPGSTAGDQDGNPLQVDSRELSTRLEAYLACKLPGRDRDSELLANLSHMGTAWLKDQECIDPIEHQEILAVVIPKVMTTVKIEDSLHSTSSSVTWRRGLRWARNLARGSLTSHTPWTIGATVASFIASWILCSVVIRFILRLWLEPETTIWTMLYEWLSDCYIVYFLRPVVDYVEIGQWYLAKAGLLDFETSLEFVRRWVSVRTYAEARSAWSWGVLCASWLSGALVAIAPAQRVYSYISTVDLRKK